jgi:protein-disulfide isomerase
MTTRAWLRILLPTAAIGLAQACEKGATPPVAPGAAPAGAPGGPAPGTPAAATPSPTPAPAAPVAGAPADPEACAKWKDALCGKAGAESEGCKIATQSASILPPAACAAAMSDLPGTVAKLGDLRKVCEQLVEKLCKDLGPESQTCGMVKQRTGGFPPERCTQMLGNYEQVIGDLRRMERANQPLSPELAAKQTEGDPPSFGPKEAKVTLVEYSDFQCPYCATAAATVKKLKDRYAQSPVRVIFRHFPLAFHKEAGPAAQAAMAAHAQGKFWEFHDLLFANQKALGRPELEKYASQLGLDLGKFKEALDKGSHQAAVDADLKLGEEIGVNGTPTLLIDRDRVQNPGDFDGLVAAIDKKLAEAGAAAPKANP